MECGLAIDEKLEQGRKLLDYLDTRTNRQLLRSQAAWIGTGMKLELDELYLFHIQEITFEKKAPSKEAMENILGTFRGMDGISFVYLILGDVQGVSFYFGVAVDKSYGQNPLFDITTLGEDILAPSIRGNFRGCKVVPVCADRKKEILTQLQTAHAAGMLEGVPGVDKEGEGFQGVDRLIDVMLGDTFGFAVIARPYTDAETDIAEKQLCELSNQLAPLARYTQQRVGGTTTNTNDSKSTNHTEQSDDSTQKVDSSGTGSSDTKSCSWQKSKSNQVQSAANESTSEQYASSRSFSKTQGSGQTEKSENTGTSSNENRAVQKQGSLVYGDSASQTDSTGHSGTTTTNQSYSENHGEHHSTSTVTGHSNGTQTNHSESVNEQMEVETKSASQWLKYIDEVLLPRLDQGRGKGIFLSCTYLFGENLAMLYRLANTAISLYSGPKGNQAALSFYKLSGKPEVAGCLHALQNLQIPARTENSGTFLGVATALSRCQTETLAWGGSWISSDELGLLAGLPQKEVIGLKLREEVEFGLNVSPVPEPQRIELGQLVQCGDVKQIPVYLNRNNLDKHTFIAGVTGSGKTTTCQNILLDAALPFLVIEPAKTEYRVLKDACPDVLFFTPGRQDVAPFFLNPFELFPGEAISSRADMLKATLEASFEMEAAIPQIMEAAIYQAYTDKGWDIQTNTWNGLGEGDGQGPFAAGVYAFPTLTDFSKAIQEVTDAQGFDQRLRDEYLGSINARIQSLMVGAKGMMLNTPRSLDFRDLVRRKVIIELEEIKNGSEKSLLMGFILTNLLQAVQACHAKDPSFQHITLIEEAHRLLSRYQPGDSMNKKQGVEVFSDMLAEVRKYGESFIIVDQIPDKMTPEVLKNTNTKIVHKLFAQDDKEAIGNTMALNDEQKAFLSNLEPGRAIMFSQGWSKAIQVQITEKSHTDRPEIDPAAIHQIALAYYAEPAVYRQGVLRGLEHLKAVSPQSVENYLHLLRNHPFLLSYQEFRHRGCLDVADVNALRKALRKAVKAVGREVLQTYMYYNLYEDGQRWDLLQGLLEKLAFEEERDWGKKDIDDFKRWYNRISMQL